MDTRATMAASKKCLEGRRDMLLDRLQRAQERFNQLDTSNKRSVAILREKLSGLGSAQDEMSRIGAELLMHDCCIREAQQKFEDDLDALKADATLAFEMASVDASPQGETTPQLQGARKLPKIELGTFDGRIAHWPNFRDTFVTYVHQSEKIPDIDKFAYLRGCLTAEASDVIEGVRLSASAYATAWKLLSDRYENPLTQVRTHVDELLDLSAARREHAASLRALLTAVRINLAALEMLERPVGSWNDIVVRLMSRRLDAKLLRDWETEAQRIARGGKLPTYDEMRQFLERRCLELEAVEASVKTTNERRGSARHAMLTNVKANCPLCHERHARANCKKFIDSPVEERRRWAKDKRVCYNCTEVGHMMSRCPVTIGCDRCSKKHHRLLHKDRASAENLEASRASATHQMSTVNLISQPVTVLLLTCVVNLTDKRGRQQEVHALLDSGSAVNLITTPCVRRLGLSTVAANIPILLAGGSRATSSRQVCTTLHSRASNYCQPLDALVLNVITGDVPSHHIKADPNALTEEMQLADPRYNEPRPVDLLLGNGVVPLIRRDNRVKVRQLVYESTELGWIVGGIPNEPHNASPLVAHVQLAQLISQFWNLENHVESKSEPVDKLEKTFQETSLRRTDGRFEVALPFFDTHSKLGQSSERAKYAFLSLERRLQKHPEIYKRYIDFMQEYRALKHMVESSGEITAGYFMPHHCVIKEDSLTTKLRVVFNASAPTSSGVSLNDILQIGPKQQDDPFAILLRFRSKQFVICADVTKMYRQVWMRRSDCKYQRIWWRDDPSHKLTPYELQTVTYGTAPASYLAIKAFRENARQLEHQYPIGARACLEDFYVDDMFAGVDSLEDAARLRREVAAVCHAGGFVLNKWSMNCLEIFGNLTDVKNSDVIIQETDSIINALGVQWQPQSDNLSYRVTPEAPSPTTKRSMLSQICQIIDPLGLVGPIVIMAKTLMQDIWRLRIGWDEAVPEQIIQKWKEYVSAMQGVQEIFIPPKVIKSATARWSFMASRMQVKPRMVHACTSSR